MEWTEHLDSNDDGRPKFVGNNWRWRSWTYLLNLFSFSISTCVVKVRETIQRELRILWWENRSACRTRLHQHHIWSTINESICQIKFAREFELRTRRNTIFGIANTLHGVGASTIGSSLPSALAAALARPWVGACTKIKNRSRVTGGRLLWRSAKNASVELSERKGYSEKESKGNW